MRDFLASLKEKMPPPNQISKGGDYWSIVEADLGLCFPPDYVAFIESYGTGSINSDLDVLNYLDPEDRERANETLATFRELREGLEANDVLTARSYKKSPDEVKSSFPWRIYPELNGLLPWGAAQDGWDFFWLTKEIPQEWGILVSYHGFEIAYPYPESCFVQFLLQLLQTPFDERFRLRPKYVPATNQPSSGKS